MELRPCRERDEFGVGALNGLGVGIREAHCDTAKHEQRRHVVVAFHLVAMQRCCQQEVDDKC